MVGFYVVMGEFGAGKTQNTTKYLKDANFSREINISNYYNGYSQFQVSNHEDLIKILSDIYDYHLYVNLYEYKDELFFHKKHLLPKYEEKAKLFFSKYGTNLKKNIRFNIALDESSIYFNPRDFKTNFSGENAKLLDFVYQPRKLNLLFFVVVQSPLELDVKFRRLATYYRKYYTGFKFIRWHKDFYFANPEDMDFENAEVVGWGLNFNFYTLFPNYDYNTKELIRPSESIYIPGRLFDYIKGSMVCEKKKVFSLKKIFPFSFSIIEKILVFKKKK